MEFLLLLFLKSNSGISPGVTSQAIYGYPTVTECMEAGSKITLKTFDVEYFCLEAPRKPEVKKAVLKKEAKKSDKKIDKKKSDKKSGVHGNTKAKVANKR